MANPRRSGSLESVGSQRRDQFVNLEWRRDHDMGHTYNERAPFVHSKHTSQHHANYNSHDEEVYNFKREVDWLSRHLHRKARIKEERTPTLSQSSSFEDNRSYWRRSRTPPSESFILASRYTLGESIITRDLGLCLREVWEMMPWEIHSFKYNAHPSPDTLSKLSSLVALIIPLSLYNGKTDSVEHVSYFNQTMAIYFKNKALMCKVFPSSLDPITMNWFDGLEEGLISSFKELIRAFGARFVTYSRVPRPLDSLLSMSMREGKTLKNYSNRC